MSAALVKLSAIHPDHPFGVSRDLKIQEIDRELGVCFKKAVQTGQSFPGIGVSSLMDQARNESPVKKGLFSGAKRLFLKVQNKMRADNPGGKKPLDRRVAELVQARKTRVAQLMQDTGEVKVANTPPALVMVIAQPEKQLGNKSEAEFNEHQQYFRNFSRACTIRAGSQEEKIYIIGQVADLYQEVKKISIMTKQRLMGDVIKSILDGVPF